MHDSVSILSEQIQLGEDSTLGLKEVQFIGTKIAAPRRNDLADDVASFANSQGGVLVLGVDAKSRRIDGIPPERMDSVEQFVAELSQDSIDPPINAVIRHLRLPDSRGVTRSVIKVKVAPSIYVHSSPSGYLMRIGSSKWKMSPDYLARLFQQRSQTGLISFDQNPVPCTTVADLNDDLAEQFLRVRMHDSRELTLQRLGIVTCDLDGVSRLSVAGTLLCTDRPHEWLPHAYIQAVAYAGNSLDEALEARRYQLDALDATGPLDVQVKQACGFVSRNQRRSATKHTGRIDFPSFDMTAVFEAMVNAVAHRDYSIRGSKIRLRMFFDRLELYIPGELASTMTPDMLAFRQATRNEVVTSLLAKCSVTHDMGGLETTRRKLMDRRGEGVPLIIERSTKISGREPVYEMLGKSELRLTIFAAQ